MKALRKGSSGPRVTHWQEFLRGLELYMGPCLGLFNDDVYQATKAFQRMVGLDLVDGVVGNDTYQEAMYQGFELIQSDNEGRHGPNWPPRPAGLRKMALEERRSTFGLIEFRHKPVEGNPEEVEVTNGWAEENVVKATIPQLAQIKGIHYRGRIVGRGPKDGVVYCHRLFVEPLRATFSDWEGAGLMPGILTYDGLLAIRFIRGSRQVLSNHCYGAAIDLNAAWNGLGCRPALVGQRGCLREHVEIANRNGIWWLGHTKKDGMHFELGVKRQDGS